MGETHFHVRVIDSDEHAEERRRELDIDRSIARRLGAEAVQYIEQGWYPGPSGGQVAWADLARGPARPQSASGLVLNCSTHQSLRVG